MEKLKSTLLRYNIVSRRAFRPKESKDSSSVVGNSRYDACWLLAEKQMPCVIWLEDLLALHGSDTQVWDLNILVEDPHIAANILLETGYKETLPDTKFENDPEFSTRAIRIAHPQSSTGIVLFRASDWYYEINDAVKDFLPPLHSFLDSMIEFWLNISSQDYVDRLGFALYIGCIINYCYYLQNPGGESVKSNVYAENLKPEHREVHYNIVSADPKEESFTTTNRHIYHVKRCKEIQQGIFVSKPYEKGVFRNSLTTVPEQ